MNYSPNTTYLQDKLGVKYNIINFGKFNTKATLPMDDPYVDNEVYRKAIKSEPDIVTIMIGGNECNEYNWTSHGVDFEKDYILLVDNFLNLDQILYIFFTLRYQ
ncbi:MAG: hypothetical protein DRP70_01050 [Spirochaetes bacterium]|nr:MAG: hypothetical protein DRP60_06070 [Spirochaetota bacterium]RKX90363.1 MAG: hypothetical protein DRP70_01050 [Spirochaetota bacterium]RKX98124.1 MAG: hypothetical protein DRZ90_03940 [Spirochaetota bacterium]